MKLNLIKRVNAIGSHCRCQRATGKYNACFISHSQLVGIVIMVFHEKLIVIQNQRAASVCGYCSWLFRCIFCESE